jgi:hypothetical protein
MKNININSKFIERKFGGWKRRMTIPAASTLLTLSVLLCLGANLRAPQIVGASAADTVNFQARLQSNTGIIVPDGYYNVEFKLYDTSSGGSALWTEDYLDVNGEGLEVKDGYLSTALGSLNAFPAIDWSQQLYLTMNIGGTSDAEVPTSFSSAGWDGEMTPRLALTATTYAFQAGQAAQASQLSTTNSGNTSTLSLQGSTHGNQTFVIQDQGAAGTYDLLTATQADSDYIQLQTGTTTPQTGELSISGSAAAGSVLTGVIDTPSAAAVTIGATNATGIDLGNATTNIATYISGTALVKPTSGHDSATALQVQNASGENLLVVDTSGSNINIGSTGSTALSSTVNLATSTGASQTVHIADGSTETSSVTVGSANGASATTIQGGTGNLSLQTGAVASSSASGAITIESGDNTGSSNTGTVTIESGAASSGVSGNVVIDTGAAGTIGSGGGGSINYSIFEQSLTDRGNATGDTSAYTLGTQFDVTNTVGLTSIWFYSGTGATSLPTKAVLYDADTGTEVTGTLDTSPDWSGAAGSGWVEDLNYTEGGSLAGTELSPGTNYTVAVFNPGGSEWYSDAGTQNYWTSGLGANGITNGPLSAPSSADALHGQALYNAGGTLAVPTSSVSGYDFGVDVEVTETSSSVATPTISIGATNAASLTIGNQNEAGSTSIQGGSGGIDLTAAVDDDITIGTENDNTITIGNGASIDNLTFQGDGIKQTLKGDSGSTASDIIQTTTNSTTAFEIQSAGSTSLFTADTADMAINIDGTLSVNGNITIDGHLVTGGSAPSIAAGAAACTSPTVNVSGDDTSGTITVTTGSGCSSGGDLATVTFASTFAAAPHVTIAPGSANASNLNAYVNNSTVSTGSFAIGTSANPSSSTTYEWNYWVAQ